MTANPESIQQRYATIERLYCEREWPQVESLSEDLLLELPDNPSDPLRQRVILLMGHTRLYGMGDVAGARGYYKALLRTEADDTLRQIADQGLNQCDLAENPPAAAAGQAAADSLPDPGTPPAGQSFPFGAPTTGEGVDQGQDPAGEKAAMPWLQALGEGSDASGMDAATPDGATEAMTAEAMAVEVIEEPEQIEVALADPQRRDDIELRELERLGPAGGVLEALRAKDEQAAATGGRRVKAVQAEASAAAAATALSPEELKELSRGLLGVVLR